MLATSGETRVAAFRDVPTLAVGGYGEATHTQWAW